MEDTNANNKRDLALKALLESDGKPFVVLVGHSRPSLEELLNGAEPIVQVVRFNDDGDFDIERAGREMNSLGLSLGSSIEELRPPPVFPIESFEKMIPFDPLERRKNEKTLEWKNKLKSLYRVKI